MSAKHFVNDPNKAVIDALRSLTLTNPSLCFDEANKIIYRHPSSIENAHDKITLICGGGSGHEPGFPGYVGRGFLTACVAGTIFASPGAEQIRTCLADRLPDSKGTLVLVMNYTGDILNFGMGVEKARGMGKNVEMVVVADDVGVGREKGGKVGRRGIAGAVLVVKICGALAETGASLEETTMVGRLAAENVVSVATSLSRVHVPGRPSEDADEELKRLPIGAAELGMGIHNEPGCEKIDSELPSVVKKMLAQLLDPDDKDRAYLRIERNDPTVMLINNFGGLSNLELGAITTEVHSQLVNEYGLKPLRVITGVINGSLNGLGFGVSIMKLTDTGLGSGKSFLDLIDAPTECIGWLGAIKRDTWEKQYQEVEEKSSKLADEVKPSNLKVDPALWKKVLNSGLECVIAAEPEVTKYDTIAGDGDCGIGLKRGAEAIQKLLEHTKPTDDALVNFHKIIQIVENTMDGTSGALYAIFLNALATNLRANGTSSPTELTPKIWARALDQSVKNLSRYTPAQPGDRTLMDALCPFIDTLQKSGSVKEAAEAAAKGAESTRGMKASLGRTVYVGGEGWQGVPDPGAYGLSEILSGFAKGL
ncbi:MAG: hypothetical protein MMC33_006166 [Icmadophila ericetorum]|nr:hypothetical protein [Icmadophila ericetorum]